MCFNLTLQCIITELCKISEFSFLITLERNFFIDGKHEGAHAVLGDLDLKNCEPNLTALGL